MTIDASSWGWPQWVVLGYVAFGLLLYAALNGKPRIGVHNFPAHLVEYAIMVAVLAFGGFFA